MTDFEKLIVSVFDAFTNGISFNNLEIKNQTGFPKEEFQQMRDDINNGNKKVVIAINDDPVLNKTLLKSMAILVKFPHYKGDEIEKHTGKTMSELDKFLTNMWGTEITYRRI